MPRKQRRSQEAAFVPEELRQPKEVKPLNKEQAELIKCIHQNDLLLLKGKAGSGKTAVCCGMAGYYLNSNLVDKIIVSRPVIASEDLGYLKGEIDQKINPYIEVLYYEFSKYFNVKKAIAEGKLIALPVAFMRSWTFNNSFVIVSEAENLTHHQFKLILTRFGLNTKLILEGDSTQSDLPSYSRNDFDVVINQMSILAQDPVNRVAIFELQQSVRNPLIEKILKVLAEK